MSSYGQQTPIPSLSPVDSLSGSEQLPVSVDGITRRATMAQVKAFCAADLTTSDDKTTQYASASVSPIAVTVKDDLGSIFLILTPTGTMANGSIKLPELGKCADRQEILVVTTQAITTLAFDANGSTLVGAPSTLAAGEFFRLRFDAVLSTWFRVG